MDDIRMILLERLLSRGLENNETALFIKDVMRIVDCSHELQLDVVKGKLNVLGWCGDYTDYGTIQLIQACYPDERNAYR